MRVLILKWLKLLCCLACACTDSTAWIVRTRNGLAGRPVYRKVVPLHALPLTGRPFLARANKAHDASNPEPLPGSLVPKSLHVEQAGSHVQVVDRDPQAKDCDVSRSYFFGAAKGIDCEGVRLFAALTFICVGNGTYEALLPRRCGVYNVTINLAFSNVLMDAANYRRLAEAQWPLLQRFPVIGTIENISIPAPNESADGPSVANEVRGIWYEPQGGSRSWCLNCPTAELDGMGDFQYTLDFETRSFLNGTPGMHGKERKVKQYRSPQAVQSCMARQGITRIAFVGDSLLRYRMHWWWWLLDTHTDIRQFRLEHYDVHVRAGSVSLSWFFDPLGLRFVQALRNATGTECASRECDIFEMYGDMFNEKSHSLPGFAEDPLELASFDVVIVGFGMWLCFVSPANLVGQDARMAELARQLKIFKKIHPHSPQCIWVDAFSEMPNHIEFGDGLVDPTLMGMVRDMAHRHLADAPIPLIDGYDISRGREFTAWDKVHYALETVPRVGEKYTSYFGSVERETSELIFEKLCS